MRDEEDSAQRFVPVLLLDRSGTLDIVRQPARLLPVAGDADVARDCFSAFRRLRRRQAWGGGLGGLVAFAYDWLALADDFNFARPAAVGREIEEQRED